MFKRICASIMAFMAVFFIFVDCTPTVQAVYPLAFLQSALFSYCASAGLQFAGSGSVLDDVQGLYDEWAEANNKPLLASYDQDSIYYNNLGSFVLDHIVASNFYAFIDAFVNAHDIEQGGSVSVGAADTWYTPGGVLVKQYTSGSGTIPNSNNLYTVGPIGKIYTSNSDFVDLYLGVSQPGTNVFVSIVPRSALGSPGSYVNSYIYVSYLYAGTVRFYYTSSGFYSNSYNLVNINTFERAVTYNMMVDDNMSTVFPFDSGTVTTNMLSRAASLTAVANGVLSSLADQLTSAQSLVVDVGAAAGSDAEDIVEAVASGVLVGEYSPTASIVATEVIDTPVQSYPDFDDLGLPQLGLALVERFPFCIPYDFVHLVSMFDAEPVAPYIVIDLFPQSFRQRIGLQPDQAIIILDFTQETYATMGTIMRWGSLVGFCFVLMGITKRLIWTS